MSKKDHSFYPAETLYSLVVCLQACCHSQAKEFKFFDDVHFAPICNTLDDHMKELSAQGFVTKKKQAIPISIQEEDKMWQENILGDDNPETLLNTLIYLLGIYLALRGVQEHKDLKVGTYSQLCIHFDDENESKYLLYKPTHLKNNQGGIKEMGKKKKEVSVYENKENPHCCVVYIFEKYMGLRLSGDPKCSIDLYLHPLLKFLPNEGPWYSYQAIGIHTLQSVTSALYIKAGLLGKRTNHGLKVTSTTRLFTEGVSEQIVCKVIGNSSEAVRAYRRKSATMQKQISEVLYGNHSGSVSMKKKDFECLSRSASKSKSKLSAPESTSSCDVASNKETVVNDKNVPAKC